MFIHSSLSEFVKLSGYENPVEPGCFALFVSAGLGR